MVEINASENGYYFTGVFTDLIQFALLCPLISSRVSFHLSLSSLEASLSHVFKDKSLLEVREREGRREEGREGERERGEERGKEGERGRI